MKSKKAFNKKTTFLDSDVDAVALGFLTKYPQCKLSIEKGYGEHGTVTSVRMVVMSDTRNLICIWIIAEYAYSIHFTYKEEVQDLIRFMQSKHNQILKTITRCFTGSNGLCLTNSSIDGSYQIHDEFYPNVLSDGGMRKLINGFRTSKSNLLILAGQWGGGKSALFQAICWEDTDDKNKYYLIDDPMVYANPSSFSELVTIIDRDNSEGKVPYLFLEEADDFIRDKRENPFLSRLASLSNGAASLKVKIVVATNDTSESSIDPALTRPGRLFSMVKFGLLNPKQSNKARQVVGLDPVEFMEDMSLSEALTETPIFAGLGTTKTKKLNMGFAST